MATWNCRSYFSADPKHKKSAIDLEPDSVACLLSPEPAVQAAASLWTKTFNNKTFGCMQRMTATLQIEAEFAGWLKFAAERADAHNRLYLCRFKVPGSDATHCFVAMNFRGFQVVEGSMI